MPPGSAPAGREGDAWEEDSTRLVRASGSGPVGPGAAGSSAGGGAEPAPHPAPLRRGGGVCAPGEMIGAYRIVEFLARGSAGEVYLVAGPDGSPAALKLLKPSVILADDTTERRFEREAEMLEALDHENIVRCLARGVDEERQQPWMALEYVPGRDLGTVLRESAANRLTVDEACFVLVRCARALTAAHDRGIIHRDLKPANVIITADGRVKLSDFGIALSRDASARLTARDEVPGTPLYVAPEVLTDSAWSPASDIYALGVFAYRILAGRPPFPYRTLKKIIRAALSEDPPRLDAVAREVPPALADLVARLLSKDPDARPTARELEGELERAGLSEETRVISRRWVLEGVGTRATPLQEAPATPARGEPTVVAELVPAPPAEPEPARDPESAPRRPSSRRLPRRSPWPGRVGLVVLLAVALGLLAWSLWLR